MVVKERRAVTVSRQGGRIGGLADTMTEMSDSLELSIVYEDGGDGWIVASIPQVPGTHSQGRTREEARANVIDALKVMLAGDDEALAAAGSGERETIILTVDP